MKTATLNTAQKLETLAEVYSPQELDHVVNNLLRFRLEDYRRSLQEYKHILEEFERKYQMASAEMNEKFESGELGDDADYFEWSSIYEFYLYVTSRIEQIEAVL